MAEPQVHGAPRIYLARHGVTQANLDRVHMGLLDVPLLAEGRAEARRVAELVHGLGVEEVWASPLRRARETAQIVAARCGVPLFVDAELREFEAGPWEGLTDAQIEARFPGDIDEWQRDPAAFRRPGRETLAALERRIVAAVERIRARGTTVLIVTHSEPIRLLRVHYADDELNRFAIFTPEHARLLELDLAGPRGALYPLRAIESAAYAAPTPAKEAEA
jgi:probable phosphoglycerate mutase